MKSFGTFLVVLLVAAIIVGTVGVISYNHEMAPTWAEIERQAGRLLRKKLARGYSEN